MVKGVNKTVIVVNDTGNKFFEKIVFYVSDEYGNCNPKQLTKAATAYNYEFLPNLKKGTLRKKHQKRRRMLNLAFCGAVLLTIVVVLALIL